MKEIKEKFILIWKDPVGSTLISAAIIAFITLVWARFSNYSWHDIYTWILMVLNYKLPLYLFLSSIGLYVIIIGAIRKIKFKKNRIFDEKVGNYTFKELVQIMQRETLPIHTRGMEMSGRAAPEDDLLLLFKVYYFWLIPGINEGDPIGEDGGYVHSMLAPKFVGYGLVETYTHPYPNLPEHTGTGYKISETGKRFHSLLDKWELEMKLKKERKEK